MSLLGEKTAIISLGMSCQTSWQIEKHLDLLKHLTGDETLNKQAFPWDWAIAPVPSVAKMMRRKRRFPRQQDLTYSFRPYWADLNIYYWHHFSSEGALLTGEDFKRTAATFRRRAKRLENALGTKRRLIFFVSNTQPGLDVKSEQTGTFTPLVRTSDMVDLRKAIASVVKRPFELVLVTCPSRYEKNAREEGIGIYLLPDGLVQLPLEKDTWKGDNEAWAHAFTRTVIPAWRASLSGHLRMLSRRVTRNALFAALYRRLGK